MRCSIPVATVAAAVVLAGCAASGGQSPGSNPAPSSSARPSPDSHLATPGIAADQRVCQRLESYPKISASTGVKKYVAWLSQQAALPGVSSVLAADLRASGADLTAYLAGNSTQSQVGADANKLQALCGAYGVG